MFFYKKADSVINVKVEFGDGKGNCIEAKYGFKVRTAYIVEVKRNLYVNSQERTPLLYNLMVLKDNLIQQG